MGIDKRRAPRARNRIRIAFADGRFMRQGMTSNLSRTGLQVACDAIIAEGTILRGNLLTPVGQLPFEATVMWARRPPRSRALLDKNTMGLRFTTQPGAAYEQLLATSVKNALGSYTLTAAAAAE